ncbi:MAG: hypothetical protein NC319_07415 [Butyricicoccus sp.]|nr:hypothetical protein [Butyricicoccus sp.]
MKKEDFFEVIGDMDGETVEQAKKGAGKKKFWSARRIVPIAAALALVIGLGSFVAGHWRMGSYAPGSSSAGGSGHDDGSTVFMHYGGPVFPMTAIEGGEGLEAERELIYDFSPWNRYWWSNEDEAESRFGLTDAERQEVLEMYNEWYPEGGQWRSSTKLLVTDAYTLTNSTEEDKTVTLLYPFVSSLNELHGDTPVMSADGAELETAVIAGGYSGGFEGVAGSDDGGLWNLAQLDSWEQYKALLGDGRYLEAALGDAPDLSDRPVVVYKFTDSYGPQADDKAGVPNPSIRAGFELDYEKTTVLSYGFNGGSWDRENGRMIRVFSIPREGRRNYGEPYYMLVVGEDIENLTTGGYVTGGTEPDTKKLPDGSWGVNVERYETDLESALRTAAELTYGGNREWEDSDGVSHEPDFEMYFGMMKDSLCNYGALSENGPARYSNGMLDETDFVAVDRVFYLKAEVKLPAGGSVKVAAGFEKEPSYDFYCAHTENQGIYGYDTVTKLGTSLDFASQTAEAVNTESVEIVRQNYGFDWENGVSRVELDLDVEHYYLEVRAKGGE